MAGRYKILDHIGAGGVGAVYKAYDTQLDRYVAIKRLLSKEEAERADNTTSTLKKEAASLATLQHPNIVSIYDLAGDDEGLFIVMELLEGDDVADWLQRGPLELADFKEFASQTLEGLLSAHQVNILHRDLKPENIKIARLPGGRLQAKIVDFGLARMSYAARKQSEDQSGNVLGSIYYMAPEQFIRRPLDGRTDLYSLGCVFYQALSGVRPFQAPTVREVMDAHLHHRVRNLAEVSPRIPVPICEWVMWLINQDQAHRPANAQAALDHLRALINAGWFNLETQAAAEAVVPVAQPVAEPVRTSSRVAAGTSGVRPATGAQPPARKTTATQRPTGAVFRPPGAGTSAVPQAVPVDVVRPAPTPKKKTPIWVFAAAAALTAVVAWMLLPKGVISGKPSAAPSQTSNGMAALPKDLLKDGVVINYRAGENMDPWLEGGESKRGIKPGDFITNWHDLERRAGDGMLSVTDHRKENCPKYIFNKPEGFKSSLGLAQFDFGDCMSHRMDKNKGEAKEYPFGEKTKDKGVTITMLVRPRLTDKEQRLFILRNQDGGGSVLVRAFPNNDWLCQAVTRGKDGKDALKSGKVTGRNVKAFSLVTVTWDGKTNKILMMVRSQDGNKSRAEFDAPKECPVLNELRLSEFSGDPKKQPDVTDKFAGDVVSLIVWPFPMDWEPRSLQDQKLAEFYFSNPGKQFN